MRIRSMGTMAMALAGLSGTAAGQTVLERTPNVGNGWWGAPGSVYFNFLHRFTVGDPPTRQVTNNPTFLLAAGLPGGALLGLNYSTRSDIAPRYPNEWEFFARHAFLRQFQGAPFDLAVQADYNLAAESLDGEVTVGRSFGSLRVLGVGRVLSNAYGSDSSRFAVGGGALLQLVRWLAIGGDAVTLLDREDPDKVAWSGALQIAIPYTPHTLSLQVANTNAATVHGSSRGGELRRYGFEFTIPITLSRYFGRGADPVAAPEPAQADTPVAIAAVQPPRPDTMARVEQPVRDTSRTDTTRVPVRDTARAPARDTARPPARDTARRDPPAQQARPQPTTVNARIRNLAFEPGRIRITAGSTVAWRNDDQVIHTVKAADGSWESPQIRPGGVYRRRFDRPGTYNLICGPHPFMKVTVEVR